MRVEIERIDRRLRKEIRVSPNIPIFHIHYIIQSLTGCALPTSFSRSMSRTSCRNLRLPPVRAALSSTRARLVAFWSNLASGCMDNCSSSSSEDISSPLESESVLRRLAANSGLAQSGVGCMRWNCLRSLRMYSLPLITSSDSVARNLRSLAWLASETARRSSSLSYQTAGADSSSSSSSSDGVSGAIISAFSGTVPESRKKSY